jgi:hypothetical protein
MNAKTNSPTYHHAIICPTFNNSIGRMQRHLKTMCMKKFIFLSWLMSSLTVVGFAQAKLHACKQLQTSGVPPQKDLEMGGKERNGTTPKRGYDYHLYLEVKKGVVPEIEYVWMNGAAYKASVLKVQSPVTVNTDVKTPYTVVKKSSNDIYVIAINDVQSKVLAAALAKNELVVGYKIKGRSGMILLKTVKLIPSEMRV